ncbi:unnamed protein product [Cercopithifilaria johnstoni]|uniref:Uncharacterized protein n=1 Tax=Cercopithifilaria johnstoni TaxID=2874296 RepID=A0A8J2PY18_9BILA|nr:unnamed protein product [Cercopithifilaria johnstoni]
MTLIESDNCNRRLRASVIKERAESYEKSEGCYIIVKNRRGARQGCSMSPSDFMVMLIPAVTAATHPNILSSSIFSGQLLVFSGLPGLVKRLVPPVLRVLYTC